MPARFRKSHRIVQQGDFDRVHASKLYAADQILVVKAVANQLNVSRLGLAVSRRVGNAVVRNRWKRLIREAFRRQQQQFPVGWDLVVRPRRGASPDAQAIFESLLRLAIRIDKDAGRQSKSAQRPAGQPGPGPRGRSNDRRES